MKRKTGFVNCSEKSLSRVSEKMYLLPVVASGPFVAPFIKQVSVVQLGWRKDHALNLVERQHLSLPSSLQWNLEHVSQQTT